MRQALNFVRQGTGSPLVLLHAVGLDLTSWDAVASRLQTAFEVVRLDLPGHGASPLPAPGATLSTYAASVADMLLSIGIERASIVGLSFGGMIAQTLAIEHPSVCGALVAAACPCTIPDPERLARAQRGRLAIERGMAGVGETTLERWFTADFIASGGAEQTRCLLLSQNPEGWSMAWQAISRLNTERLLPTIRAPTLCLAGDQDRATAVEAVRTMAHLITGAEFKILSGAPHMMHLERPGEFSCLVGDFLLANRGR